MGRVKDLIDKHMDMKNAQTDNSNGISRDTIRVAPRISEESHIEAPGVSEEARVEGPPETEKETDHSEVKECTRPFVTTDPSRLEVVPVVVEECEEKKQDTTNVETPGSIDGSLTVDVTPVGGQKSANPSKTNSPVSSRAGVKHHHTVPHPFSLATDKRASCATPCSVKLEMINKSRSSNPTKSQPNSPPSSRKRCTADNKKHHDEEDDNSSLVSAFAVSSGRANKPKTTVASAPTFRSSERAEKRKQFNLKLEEKNQALAAERSELDARLKEEQEAAIKQLRKGMVVKANPVPSFYQEGCPPKAELKKLPLTCPKSPNLTRRKSCNDAVNYSCQKDKETGCSRPCRHSISHGDHKAAPISTADDTSNAPCQVKVPLNTENVSES